jgi:hypothetical protein
VGTGARLAATAILFGTSSIAGAKSFERFDTPVLALLAPPPPAVSNDGSNAEGDWSSYSGSPQWLRLSLDGAPWKTGRPIRTTLLPAPTASAPPSPALPPVPSPDQLLAAPASAATTAASAESLARSPNEISVVPFEHPHRYIRVSLDQASVGELGHAEGTLPRPIRLFLGSDALGSPGPRPFRAALD